MNFASYYNNLGIEAFALASVLSKAKLLTLPQVALVLPIVAHKDMTKQLARARFRFSGFEEYLIENVEYFYNFADRYSASLTPTVNAIQFLNEIGVAELRGEDFAIVSELPFNSAMGKRAERIERASANIAKLVSGNAEIFYLNARIDL